MAPIWFVLDDDGSVVFTTAASSVKGKTLRRDPRVSLCVDDETTAVRVRADRGHRDHQRGPRRDARLGDTHRRPLHGRDQAEAFGRRNAVEGELLVRLTPERVVARRNIAD